MPHLFFAIVPPLNVLETIGQHALPALWNHADWRIATPSQWHITVHYIGYVSPAAEEKVLDAFQTLRMPRAEKIIIGGNPSTGLLRHDLLYARVDEAHPFLSHLRTIIRSIAPVSERENIIFHLTLARAKKKRNPSTAIISAIPSFTSTFLPGGVTLFRAEQQNGKTIHIPLSTRAFSL